MPISKHQEIRDAVLAKLAPISGGNVKPGRSIPMPEQDAQLVKVYLDQSSKTRLTLKGQPEDWATRVRIEFIARGTDLVTGEDQADALLVAGYALVMADPSLGGLTMDLEAVAIAWATDEAQESIGVAQLLLEAQHRTPANTIST